MINEEIIYPADPCSGPFFINYQEPFEANINFFFTEFSNPVPGPFTFIEKDGPDTIMSLFSYWPSNFSAFNRITNSYVYEYLYGQFDQKSITFQHHNNTTGVTTLTNSGEIYASPVFMKGELFGIRLIRDATFVQYEIWELNPLTGVKTGVFSTGTFLTNSPASMETMSSASDGDDKIYFLSGVDLIEGVISTNTSSHIQIDPTYDPMINPIWYYGLEYQDSTGRLLAMFSYPESQSSRFTDLVTLESITPPSISSVFNIAGSLPESDKYIDAQYYSTTYDPCENTYYITEKGDTSSTNLIEINLSAQTLKMQTLFKYWYGVQWPEAK